MESTIKPTTQAHNPFESAIQDAYRNAEATIASLKEGSTYVNPKQEKVEINFAFRPDQVVDKLSGDGHQIEASKELLARWDTRKPIDIFKVGFVPRVQDIAWNMKDQWNFKNYQEKESVSSVFVATARYFPKTDGHADVWKPQTWQTGTIYLYGISGCYGGIDVVNTLEGKNKYSKEQEITFVGGIKREFIHYAIQYVGGVAKKIFYNGPDQAAPPLELPADLETETI